MFSKINKKTLKLRKQDIVFLFSKKNISEFFLTFIASQIFSFIPVIGNMLSFAIRTSYAVKLYRIKSNIIKADEESSFESILDILKFQLWIYIPLIVVAFIMIMLKYFIPFILFVLIFKSPVMLYLILDVVFIILGFGLFVNYSLNKNIKLKIALNIVKEHFGKILFCFLPFVIWTGVMFLFVSLTNIDDIPELIHNNIPWLTFNFIKYYLFLIGVISLAKEITLQKE